MTKIRAGPHGATVGWVNGHQAKTPWTPCHPGTIQNERCFLREDARPAKLVDGPVWTTLSSSAVKIVSRRLPGGSQPRPGRLGVVLLA